MVSLQIFDDLYIFNQVLNTPAYYGERQHISPVGLPRRGETADQTIPRVLKKRIRRPLGAV